MIEKSTRFKTEELKGKSLEIFDDQKSWSGNHNTVFNKPDFVEEFEQPKYHITLKKKNEEISIVYE